MLFQDWSTLARTLVVAVLAYAALLMAVRASGKRTLSKLNAFDFIVTVALGSTLASVAVSPDVALAEGAVAFAVLVSLQYAIAALQVRLPRFQRLVKARPTLLLRDGTPLDQVMRRQRVARAEILQAVRQHGFASLRDVAAVVLETDGSLSVIADVDGPPTASAMVNVDGWHPAPTDDGGRRGPADAEP